MLWNEDEAGRAEATGVEYLDGLYSYAMVLDLSRINHKTS